MDPCPSLLDIRAYLGPSCPLRQLVRITQHASYFKGILCFLFGCLRFSTVLVLNLMTFRECFLFCFTTFSTFQNTIEKPCES